MQRIVMHMDLDSFYAAVEEKRRPEIRGRPIVICVFSGRSADSGAVATANYRARGFGIKSGMPIAMAKRLADGETVFLRYDIDFYREVSDRIMGMLEEDCDVLEQASIDEAYLDVSRKSMGSWENAEQIAMAIKRKIRETEDLTCSIGIGPNKLMAKMAGKTKKPDGLTAVKDEDVGKFISGMDAGKIHGIGAKTAEALNSMGIRTAGDLAKFSPLALEQKFGKNKARLLQEKAQGRDESPVEERVPQQISRIGTLRQDTRDVDEIFEKLKELAAGLETRIRKKNVSFRTVSIIAIDTGLEMQTRSETIAETGDVNAALETAKSLLHKFLSDNPDRRLRRAGIRVSNLVYKKEQKSLGDFATRYFMR